MILRMLQHHYDPTLPLTPPTTSHHRRGRQGPLHTNWRSHHRPRCPPTPSSSSTAAIITITGLVVAWCHLPPPSSSPLSSTADATPPTTKSPPPRLVIIPPLRPSPPPLPSRPLRPLDRPWCRQRQCPPSRSDAASAAPERAPLVGIWTHCASAAVTLRRPAVYPPSLLGPPPPVRRRQRQHGNVDGCPWQPSAATTTP